MTIALDRSKGTTDHARSFVASNFAPREHYSGILAITFFGLGVLAIAATANRMDPAQAIYSAGLTSCAAGLIMLIGWGAAGGHGGVCICTADVIAQRAEVLDAQYAEINARLAGLERACGEVTGAMRDNARDELARRRNQN